MIHFQHFFLFMIVQPIFTQLLFLTFLNEYQELKVNLIVIYLGLQTGFQPVQLSIQKFFGFEVNKFYYVYLNYFFEIWFLIYVNHFALYFFIQDSLPFHYLYYHMLKLERQSAFLSLFTFLNYKLYSSHVQTYS